MNLERRTAMARLLEGRDDDLLVVPGLGSTAWDLAAAGDNDRNFYLWGAMGGAAMIGLGLALAQPKRPVLVVTGDGEQLMGIGSLLTIATKQPGNLSIAVLDNGHFGETGMQLSHSGLGAKLEVIASGAGIGAVSDIADIAGIENFRKGLRDVHGGPRLARIRISTGEVERALPPRDGAYLKNRFRGHLGFAVS